LYALKKGKFGLERPSAAAELMCYIQACHFDFIFMLGYSTGKLKIRHNIERACCWWLGSARDYTAGVDTLILKLKRIQHPEP
jgi:hypothetical protein